MTNFNNIWKDFIKNNDFKGISNPKKQKLNENINIYDKTDENILGKWAWPSADQHLRDIVDEPDTEIEKNLYIQLHKHFGAVVKGGAPIDQESVGAIKQILDSGDYSNVFKQCKGTGNLVRGMSVPLEWIRKHAPEALESMPDVDGELDWTTPTPISYSYESAGKYGNISSWTANKKVASRFASTIAKSGNIPCILYTNCETGLFLDTSPFEKYAGGDYNYDDGKKIKKLNPQGKKEVEYLLFGGCEVNAIQLRGNKPTQIDEKLLRERTEGKLLWEVDENELDHIKRAIYEMDPDELAFNSLFSGQMRRIIPFSTAGDDNSEMGKFILFLNKLRNKTGEFSWEWEPNFATGTVSRNMPPKKRRDNLPPVPSIDGKPPKMRKETLKIGKLLNKLAQLAEKAQKIYDIAPSQRSEDQKKAYERLISSLEGLSGEYAEVLQRKPHIAQEQARFWELTAAALFKKNPEAHKSDAYSIIITRNPVDILRASDFRKIESCHSPPSRGGDSEYYKCIVAEAHGHGAIAYIVQTKDLLETYSASSIEEVENNELFQDEEIFDDTIRPDADGELEPIARVRLRQIKFDDREELMGEIAVPEMRVYGQAFKDFYDIVLKFARKEQEQLLSVVPMAGDKVDFNEFTMYGGSYEDTPRDLLLRNLLNVEESDVYGTVDQDTETEEELPPDISSPAQRLEAESEVIKNKWNDAYVISKIDFNIEDDGAGGAYIEVGGTMRPTWDKEEWLRWPHAGDIADILADVKEHMYNAFWIQDSYTTYLSHESDLDQSGKVGFTFSVEPEGVAEFMEATSGNPYAAHSDEYEIWGEAIKNLDKGHDQLIETINMVAKQQGWMEGGQLINLGQKVENEDIDIVDWYLEVDGEWPDYYEVSATVDLSLDGEDIAKFSSLTSEQWDSLLNSRELRGEFRRLLTTESRQSVGTKYWTDINTEYDIKSEDDIEYRVILSVNDSQPDKMVELFVHTLEETDDEFMLKDILISSIDNVLHNIKTQNMQENLRKQNNKLDNDYFVKRWKLNFE
tara:strand:+ start:3635 stop:6712 length:3078 start_codon:yes stop_codon:yes gene_type:complete